MTSTLLFQITQKETDADDNVSDEKTYLLTDTFTFLNKQQFTLVSGNAYFSISFGQVATASAIRINTDQDLTVKINGGSEEFTISKALIWIGEMTALSVKNNSGDTATVTVEVYGG